MSEGAVSDFVTKLPYTVEYIEQTVYTLFHICPFQKGDDCRHIHTLKPLNFHDPVYGCQTKELV